MSGGAADEAAWRAAADKALKGAAVETLASQTADGIPLQPLYPAYHGPARCLAPAAVVRVAQRLDHANAAIANGQALADLEGGAGMLVLVFDGAPSARGFGLPAEQGSLEAALEGARPGFIPIRLEAGGGTAPAARALFDLLDRRGLEPAGLDVELGLDPAGAAALGGFGEDESEAVLGLAAERGFAGRIFLADGRLVHEAGAGEAEELGAVLASGVEALRRLEGAGQGLGAAREKLSFLIAADVDLLATIAKFRALRLLWARVEEACGLQPLPIRVHAETAWRMLSRRDPDTNMLRNAVAAAGAILGGADSLAVLPHTSAHGLADAFARRVARNTALVLLEEAHLARVADPAGGSGAVEALTDALAETGWAAFRRIEGEGGILASLKDGALPARIAASAARRDADLREGRTALVGTTIFPPAHRPEVAVLEPAPPAAAAPGAALVSRRLAEPFEEEAR